MGCKSIASFFSTRRLCAYREVVLLLRQCTTYLVWIGYFESFKCPFGWEENKWKEVGRREKEKKLTLFVIWIKGKLGRKERKLHEWGPRKNFLCSKCKENFDPSIKVSKFTILPYNSLVIKLVQEKKNQRMLIDVEYIWQRPLF